MVHVCDICPNNKTYYDPKLDVHYTCCGFTPELLDDMELQGVDLREVDCRSGGIFEMGL